MKTTNVVEQAATGGIELIRFRHADHGRQPVGASAAGARGAVSA